LSFLQSIGLWTGRYQEHDADKEKINSVGIKTVIFPRSYQNSAAALTPGERK